MRRLSIETWLFILVAAANIYAACLPANSLMNWFFSDDAFYYFKTAQNISEGYGITFDRLGRDSGFHPLWMAVLIPIFALARFDLILPLRLVIAVSGLLSAATAVVLYHLLRRALSCEASALAALFFAFSTYTHNNIFKMGLESPLSAFFLALLFARVAATTASTDEQPGGRLTRREYRELLLTGLVATLAVLARLDNVFYALAAGAWIVVRPRRMRVLLALDVALVITGVLWSYFTRVGFGPHYNALAASSYWMAPAAMLVRLPVYYLFGLYRLPAPGRKATVQFLARIALAAASATLLLSAIMLALFATRAFPGFPRLVLVYEAVFSLGALLLTRLGAVVRPLDKLTNYDGKIAWRPSITRGLLFAIPLAATLVLYMGANQFYFGTPMPVSGQIKRWWGTLPNPAYGKPVTTLGQFLTITGRIRPWGLVERIMSRPEAVPAPLRQAGYTAVAIFFIYKRRKHALCSAQKMALLPVFTGAMIHIISYTGTGYIHMRSWYWTAQMMLVVFVFGIFLDAMLNTVASSASTYKSWKKLSVNQPIWILKRPERAAAFFIGAIIVVYGVFDIVKTMPPMVDPSNLTAYRSGIDQLEEATEPGSIIGSSGGGIIAYFVKDRTIVNLDGLMNTTEYFHMLQEGTASQYLDRIGMQYVYSGSTVITDSDPYFQFSGRLEKIRDFPGITLFRWLKAEKFRRQPVSWRGRYTKTPITTMITSSVPTKVIPIVCSLFARYSGDRVASRVGPGAGVSVPSSVCCSAPVPSLNLVPRFGQATAMEKAMRIRTMIRF